MWCAAVKAAQVIYLTFSSAPWCKDPPEATRRVVPQPVHPDCRSFEIQQSTRRAELEGVRHQAILLARNDREHVFQPFDFIIHIPVNEELAGRDMPVVFRADHLSDLLQAVVTTVFQAVRQRVSPGRIGVQALAPSNLYGETPSPPPCVADATHADGKAQPAHRQVQGSWTGLSRWLVWAPDRAAWPVRAHPLPLLVVAKRLQCLGSGRLQHRGSIATSKDHLIKAGQASQVRRPPLPRWGRPR